MDFSELIPTLIIIVGAIGAAVKFLLGFLKNELEERDAQVGERDEKIDEMEQRIAELFSDTMTLRERIIKLEHENEVLKAEITKLQAENERLREVVKEQNCILAELNRGIKILIEQVRRMGQEPKWTPSQAFDYEVSNDDNGGIDDWHL